MKEFFRGFKLGMKNFSHPVATLVNSLLLLVVYIVGVGATTILTKLSGKKLMHLQLDKKKKTYWDDLGIDSKKTESAYRQF